MQTKLKLNAKDHVENRPKQDQSEPTELDWQRREKKRANAIAMFKRSAEYIAAKQATNTDDAGTPDPRDRGLSKRGWEKAIALWRNAIRAKAAANSNLCAINTTSNKDVAEEPNRS